MKSGVDYAATAFGGSKAAMARAFKISPQAITKWAHEGIPPARCIVLHTEYGLDLARLAKRSGK